MDNHKVTIIDYGMCNLLNVARAFDTCGAHVEITDDPSAVLKADRLVIPGVGAFSNSLAEIKRLGLDDAIRSFVQSGRPVFGICVGMQVLFETSEEFGTHEGLGILKGRVVAVPDKTIGNEPQRVPHIGWAHLIESDVGQAWEASVLRAYIGQTPAVYFVHSFVAKPENDLIRLADFSYGGHRLCAAVMKDNLVASQFHPERSGKVGLSLIKQFIFS